MHTQVHAVPKWPEGVYSLCRHNQESYIPNESTNSPAFIHPHVYIATPSMQLEYKGTEHRKGRIKNSLFGGSTDESMSMVGITSL